MMWHRKAPQRCPPRGRGGGDVPRRPARSENKTSDVCTELHGHTATPCRNHECFPRGLGQDRQHPCHGSPRRQLRSEGPARSHPGVRSNVDLEAQLLPQSRGGPLAMNTLAVLVTADYALQFGGVDRQGPRSQGS